MFGPDAREHAIDETRVVGFRDLLERATKARGRFVPLGDGEYGDALAVGASALAIIDDRRVLKARPIAAQKAIAQ